MTQQPQDNGVLRVHTTEIRPESVIRVDGPTIVVVGAYCPSGHDLVDHSGPKFAGFPGIKLRIRHDQGLSDVILSPIHGDHSKRSEVDLPRGTKCEVLCPECGCALPELAPCDCPEGGTLVTIYLSSKLDKGSYAAVCNVWGCHRSRLVDSFTLISEFVNNE